MRLTQQKRDSMSNQEVTIKLKDKKWSSGHLRGTFVVSTFLATQIVALIANNPHHDFTPKVVLRDEKGRYTSPDPLQSK